MAQALQAQEDRVHAIVRTDVALAVQKNPVTGVQAVLAYVACAFLVAMTDWQAAVTTAARQLAKRQPRRCARQLRKPTNESTY